MEGSGGWHPEYRFNDAAFVPAQMTPEELTGACLQLRNKFNSIPNLVWRFMDLKTNMRTLRRMATFWQFNPVFRKEVFKKQGMRFGLALMKRLLSAYQYIARPC